MSAPVTDEFLDADKIAERAYTLQHYVETARIIMEEGNSIDIADAARSEGFNDLRTSALIKCASGVTSLEEVNRVTKD